MSDTFPFRIVALPEHLRVDDARFGITAAVEADPALEGYFDLFESYGYGGGGPSWQEHILTILEEADPALLDELHPYSTPAHFLLYADSEAAVQGFLRVVRPVFADLGSLNHYFRQADPTDFFE